MPPPPLRRKGKEPKETVIYPSSKRPAPPFKPLRPSKVPRVDSEVPAATSSTARPPASKAAATRRPPPPSKLTANRAPAVDENDSSKTISSSDHEVVDDEDELEAALTTNPPKAARPSKPTAPKPNAIIPISPPNDPLPQTRTTEPQQQEDPLASQSDPTPSIPQPLLLRLLHENFTDPNTKIDKHALQVLQKYMEIFVREAIARAKHGKVEAGAEGNGDGEDELGGGGGGMTWLELEDLERVAPGLLCEF